VAYNKEEFMVEKMIAFCGLDCAACPAFHASERRSMTERQKTADQWSKDYNFAFKAADIDCVGCTLTEGKQIGNCAVCGIRLCGLEKKVSTCAACPDFGCEKLESMIKNIPAARANLLALRAGM
jgi:hypothetical protein